MHQTIQRIVGFYDLGVRGEMNRLCAGGPTPKSLQPIYLVEAGIVPHFDLTNLRGIVRPRYLCEVHDETDPHGGGWISRWVLRCTIGKSESPRVFPAAAQDARSRETEWPDDPQTARCPFQEISLPRRAGGRRNYRHAVFQRVSLFPSGVSGAE